MKSMRVDGAKALVTGAGTGIGQATACQLARAGAKEIVIVGRREDPLLATKNLVAQQSPECLVHAKPCDIAEQSERAELSSWVKQEFGSLDILINNAGLFSSTPLRDTTNDAWGETFAINVTAQFALIRDLIDCITKSALKSVVNISSTLALKPIPNTASYNASKAAILGLTKSLALELGAEGVRVNAILPAIVETPMYRNRFPDEADYNNAISTMSKFHPLGRVGTPDDIALAVVFLSSPAASWITGVALPVDGGMLCT